VCFGHVDSNSCGVMPCFLSLEGKFGSRHGEQLHVLMTALHS